MIKALRPALAVAALCLAPVAGAPPPEPKPVAAPHARAATTCAEASLALAPDTVVGALDGVAVKLSDLGDEARRAEEKALWEYCDAVYAMRSRALDGYV